MVLTIISLVWLHFVSDFLLQSDWMAKNKSTNIAILNFHVVVYSIPFFILFGFWYAFSNFLLHFLTDFFSSRATAALWKRQQHHWFFAVIGLDQAIHLTCLIVTIPLMEGPIWQ